MAVYAKLINGYSILYLRNSAASGYSEYTGGPIAGNTDKNYNIVQVITETTIILPASCESMLSDASQLTSLDVSQWDVSNVTDMSSMFTHCLGLTSLDLSLWNTANATNMSYLFGYCRNLEHIYINPSLWNTGNVTNSSMMFENCYALHNYNYSDTDKTRAYYGNGGYLESLLVSTPKVPNILISI